MMHKKYYLTRARYITALVLNLLKNFLERSMKILQQVQDERKKIRKKFTSILFSRLNSRYLLIIMAYLSMSFYHLHGCIITFINDSARTAMIVNKKDGICFLLKRNGRRRFGSADEHASFKVYGGHMRTDLFRLLYKCEQKECATNGNPRLKFSDLEDGQGAAKFFVVTKNENPHTSMVQGLPIIQKKHCSSCHE